MVFLKEIYSEVYQGDYAIEQVLFPNDLVIFEDINDMTRIVKDDCYTFLNLKTNSAGTELNLLKMITEDIHNMSIQFDEEDLNNKFFIEDLVNIFKTYNFNFKNKAYNFAWSGKSFISKFNLDYGDGNNFNDIEKYLYKIIERVLYVMNISYDSLKVSLFFKKDIIILHIKTSYEDSQSSEPNELLIGNSEMEFPKTGFLFDQIDRDIFHKKMLFENEKREFYNKMLELLYDEKVNIRERFTNEFSKLNLSNDNFVCLTLNFNTDVAHLDLKVIKNHYVNPTVVDFVIEKLNKFIFGDEYYDNKIIQIIEIKIMHQDKLNLVFKIHSEFIEHIKNKIYDGIRYGYRGAFSM